MNVALDLIVSGSDGSMMLYVREPSYIRTIKFGDVPNSTPSMKDEVENLMRVNMVLIGSRPISPTPRMTTSFTPTALTTWT